MRDLNVLTDQIEMWAKSRSLHGAEPEKQMLKLMEEIGELSEGLAKGKKEVVKDSIGDAFVVLTILSMQCETDIRECVEYAYNEIKDRKGKMVNGVFVKESDLQEG
ncbi:MazG-like family protein [Gracilibacillus saliphilus]|uniref:MazG-like family protein n=1 Tax=Gracilibacillus saliphilus TaxID=543890 RepID=UPI0013D1944C|nr:MazG-like family protein [Gracilibacillus saliphilus]